jgi:large subunit ribosomal protein L7/L12
MVVSVRITAINHYQKISIIKALRTLTSLGLKEAKELVDSVGFYTQQLVLSAVDLETANKARAELEAAGATVSVG